MTGSQARRPAKPTMHDVAKLAGVSQTTVSLVVNGATRIPASTQQKVNDAIAELKFRPSTAARNLRLRRSNTIGVITDHIVTHPFAGQMLRGAQELAWEHGYLLLIVDTEKDATTEVAAIDALLARQVDGLLYAAQSWREVHLPQAFSSVPSLLVNAWPSPDLKISAVRPDEEYGGRLAAEAALSQGHRKIALFSGPRQSPASIERERGFRSALTDAGVLVDENWIRYGDRQISSGFALGSSIEVGEDSPTAIVCGNDRMAVGVIARLMSRGLSVPDDVSVIGYDDQESLADQFPPTLTTVSIPHYEFGRAAIQTLLNHLIDQSPLQDQTIRGELVWRGSVGPPRLDSSARTKLAQTGGQRFAS